MFGPYKESKALHSMAFGAYNNGFGEPRTQSDWISSIPEEVDKYIADPMCGFIPKVSMFRDMMYGVMYISDMENVSKMNKDMPVLIISGWKDPVGENGKGVKRVFRMFCEAGMKHVHIKLYPGCRHELLNDVCREQVMEDIVVWIDAKLAAADAAETSDVQNEE